MIVRTVEDAGPYKWILSFVVGATFGRPSLYTISVRFRDAREVVPYKENIKTKTLFVILSAERRVRPPTEVEVFSSEQRGKTEERMRRWDLVTSLGGFLQ